MPQGRLDACGGEVLDLTLRLPRAGWSILFAENATCFTDVPHPFQALVRQRFRWERDAGRLRYRKHAGMLNPFSRKLKISEVFNEIEFLVFNVVAAVVMPIYLVWRCSTFGASALPFLIAAQVGLLSIDTFVFLFAGGVTPGVPGLGLLASLPGYSSF